MDYAITFALLLYINVFYFGLYACVEFGLLVFKCYQVRNSYVVNELKHSSVNFLL